MLAMLACVGLLGGAAQAQTAHAGNTVQLGSGFRGPFGVAVDGSGNVFVADQINNAVKEIVAVNGVIPAANPAINTLGSGFLNPSGVAVEGVETSSLRILATMR
jgi:DNA-binding beta-propeller fold protein YncE